MEGGREDREGVEEGQRGREGSSAPGHHRGDTRAALLLPAAPARRGGAGPLPQPHAAAAGLGGGCEGLTGGGCPRPPRPSPRRWGRAETGPGIPGSPFFPSFLEAGPTATAATTRGEQRQLPRPLTYVSPPLPRRSRRRFPGGSPAPGAASLGPAAALSPPFGEAAAERIGCPPRLSGPHGACRARSDPSEGLGVRAAGPRGPALISQNH